MKQKYIEILIVGSNKVEIWPFEEAQDYSLALFDESDVIWLTDEELKERTEVLERGS